MLLKKKITKREEREVSEKTRARIKQARAASGIAVKVTQTIVIGTRAACNEFAIAISETAMKTKAGREFANNDNATLQTAKEVGKATISGALLIIEELENAAVLLVSEVANAGANVAEHKYGAEMGEAAKDVAGIVSDSAAIVKNVGDVGVKSLVGRTVGHAAIDVMSTEEQKRQERRERDADASLDPSVKTAALMAATMVANSDTNTKK